MCPQSTCEITINRDLNTPGLDIDMNSAYQQQMLSNSQQQTQEQQSRNNLLLL
jgi:uncharacterized protein